MIFEVYCPECGENSWKYWVVFGDKTEYRCIDCGFKIKHLPEYEYEYKTYKLWDFSMREPVEGTYEDRV